MKARVLKVPYFQFLLLWRRVGMRLLPTIFIKNAGATKHITKKI
jgi:hypothetical protein